mmetsp:Transcript_110339/g.172597  ORF Transcript_110339/g.172597 Transcript_110339/m.172597 type:complete len:334 (+) Transcript_110339:56-1057(+)
MSILPILWTFLANAGLALDSEGVRERLESIDSSYPSPATLITQHVRADQPQKSLASFLLGGHVPFDRRISTRSQALSRQQPLSLLDSHSLRPRPMAPTRRSTVALDASTSKSSSTAPKKVDEKLWVVAAFAFLAGLIDTAISCRYEFFACRMTGNAANLMRVLTPGGPPLSDLGFTAGMVGNFILGSAIYRFLDLKLKKISAKTVLAPVIFTLLTLHDITSARAITRWPSMFLTLAMGMVTAISTAVTGAVTFVMSGHLLKIGGSLAELLATGLSPAGKAALRKSIVALSFFLFGAGANSFTSYCPTPFFTTMGAAHALLLLLYSRFYEKAKA